MKKEIERIIQQYFVKVYYDSEGKSFDWMLNTEYCAEDLKDELERLSDYPKIEAMKIPKDTLKRAYELGQKSVDFIKLTNDQKDKKNISNLLSGLTPTPQKKEEEV